MSIVQQSNITVVVETVSVGGQQGIERGIAAVVEGPVDGLLRLFGDCATTRMRSHFDNLSSEPPFLQQGAYSSVPDEKMGPPRNPVQGCRYASTEIFGVAL